MSSISHTKTRDKIATRCSTRCYKKSKFVNVEVYLISRPRQLIRIDWACSQEVESRSGRIFLIVDVHIQYAKLFKVLEFTVLPMILCTINIIGTLEQICNWDLRLKG